MREYIKQLLNNGEPYIHYFTLLYTEIIVSIILLILTIGLFYKDGLAIPFGVALSAFCGLAGFSFKVGPKEVKEVKEEDKVE